MSSNELEALVSVLELAGGKLGQNWTLERKPREGTARVPSVEKSVASLESMGVKIYGLDEAPVYSSNIEISWDNIAGYDQQKRYVKDHGALHPFLLYFQSYFVYYYIFFTFNQYYSISCNENFLQNHYYSEVESHGLCLRIGKQ